MEYAARACGLVIVGSVSGRNRQEWMKLECGSNWNPLLGDGDFARMEAALLIEIEWDERRVVAHAPKGVCEYCLYVDHGDNKQAARRTASLRVLAEIGKSMP